MNLTKLDQHPRSVIDFIRWYQEPGRYYHNLTHIKECLNLYREIKDLLVDPQSVWLAIWFHDCVYSTLPDAKNEEQSAAESRRWVRDEERKKVVTRLIMVTKHSDAYPPMTTDECFMCDIDLASLGAPAEQFDQNSANIRLEYSRYEDAVYNAGRVAILQMFLKRALAGKLYYTSYFKERYNEQAKMNLMREITRLQNSVYKYR